MERWNNRTAVVTGASSGIGAAIARHLANKGLIVVGLARRVERVEALRSDVNESARKRIHAVRCDMRNEEDVKAAFKEIEAKYGHVAVLVNNAGLGRSSALLDDGRTQDSRDIIQTNVMGIVYATREAFRSMKENGGYGHVFLINSIVGHKVNFAPHLHMNLYAASKYAVTALAEIYRQEFLEGQTKVKITSISPGLTESEVGGNEEIAEFFAQMPRLRAEDVADALAYCLQTPPLVQIHELTIKAVGEQM